ncbi:MAG: hypothetical protein GY913_05660 [Proteobacteria bacterium]|nr:hypothetical protein [Pseudomonadota bacterium]MCP4916390.1 hypothetical protein [Pseudomonadota bacterium]
MLLLVLACTPQVPPIDTPEPDDTAMPEDTGCEATTWFLDEDGDGAGDDASAYDACEARVGSVISGGDCDDEDAEIGPDAEEICGDSVDNDCDSSTDEAEEGCEPAPDYRTLDFADSSLASIVGETPNASVALRFDVADQDGDGVLDVAIYNTVNDDNPERVFFFDGSELEMETTLSQSTHVFGDVRAGSALFVPDRDGDGEMELFMSDSHGTAQTYPYPEMYFADSSTWDGREVDLVQARVAIPIGDWSGFGEEFMSVDGDFDGDGSVDLAVGDRWDSDAGWHAGAVTIYYGGWEEHDATTKLVGDTSKSYVPGVWGAVGDLDGDGLDDLVISDNGYANSSLRGIICIEPGSHLRATEVRDPNQCHSIIGNEDQSLLSHNVAVLPDLDGDGADELAVDHEGGIHLFSGAEITESNRTITFIYSQSVATIEPRSDGEGGPWSASMKGPLASIQGATGEGSLDLAAVGTVEGQDAVFLFDVQAAWDQQPVRALDAHTIWVSDREFGALHTFGDFNDGGRTDLLVGTVKEGGPGALTVLATE